MAERGRGKTMTLLSATSDLEQKSAKDNKSNVKSTFVLRFFFKQGDTELESALRSMESLLRQLLTAFRFEETAKNINHVEERKRKDMMAKIRLVLEENRMEDIKEEAKRGGMAGEGSPGGLLEEIRTPELICKIMSEISLALNIRLYVVVDALDECQDSEPLHLLDCLINFAYSVSHDIRVLVSMRTRDAVKESLQEMGASPTVPAIELVHLTENENASELQTYLEHKLRLLFDRQKKVVESTSAYQQSYSSNTDRTSSNEMIRGLAKEIKEGAKGNFSSAGMVIANLHQPSRKSLKARVRELKSLEPRQIYQKSLDLLTADERVLIIFALKWVVWAASEVIPLEIAEHFKEIYYPACIMDQPESSLDVESLTPRSRCYDPANELEIKEIIYHLGTAGRDFFGFKREEEPIAIHTSVREWVMKGETGSVELEKPETRVTRSADGRLLFEISVLRELNP
ncbi:hypothetical protein ABW19_dt0209841 [Dactylella cylindrospora]|nr:hypothetical protein ABW19_dt0209841 [Dactylella cylindrospora]